jgi:NAD(P)-dependent dehydrogenase (short-subunit alcohol dehydrogenase family)
MAHALIEDGWSVIGLSRTPPSELGDLSLWSDVTRFVWQSTDVGNLSDVASAAHLFGDELDALIHCAAEYGPIGPLGSLDMTAWAQTIQTNLVGTAAVVQAAIPSLRYSEDARALLFLGGGAFNPRPRYSAYAASKSGVVSLVETLAEELAPRITVNGVSPGFVPTAIHQATLNAGPDAATDSEYAQARLAETYAPEAMARVVACVRHLLSPQTRGLTGKVISAPHDAWASITPADVESLNDSPLWTRTRLGRAEVPTLERITPCHAWRYSSPTTCLTSSRSASLSAPSLRSTRTRRSAGASMAWPSRQSSTSRPTKRSGVLRSRLNWPPSKTKRCRSSPCRLIRP